MGKGDKWRKGHSLKKFGDSYDDINWGGNKKRNSDIINYGKSNKTKDNRKKSR